MEEATCITTFEGWWLMGNYDVQLLLQCNNLITMNKTILSSSQKPCDYAITLNGSKPGGRPTDTWDRRWSGCENKDEKRKTTSYQVGVDSDASSAST